MVATAALRTWLKRVLPPPISRRVQLANQWLRSLCPDRFESIAYVVEEAPAPDLGEVTVDLVESRQRLTAEQDAFLKGSDLIALVLWTLMKQLRAGPGWLFLARAADGQYCAYVWVVSKRYLTPRYPFMEGEKALFLGPIYTDPRYRGRGIIPLLMQYALHHVIALGYGPVYGLVAPHNKPSIRGCAKAGFKPLGIWAGTSYLRDRFVRTGRVADSPPDVEPLPRA